MINLKPAYKREKEALEEAGALESSAGPVQPLPTDVPGTPTGEH